MVLLQHPERDEDRAQRTEDSGGRAPPASPDDGVTPQRPTDDVTGRCGHLTRAIRQEVLKEVSHLLNEKYDVELDEEDRKQLSGEV